MGGGLVDTGGLFLLRGGGLFDSETKMVSVLHKELEYKVEKLKYKKLEIMQPVHVRKLLRHCGGKTRHVI